MSDTDGTSSDHSRFGSLEDVADDKIYMNVDPLSENWGEKFEILYRRRAYGDYLGGTWSVHYCNDPMHRENLERIKIGDADKNPIEEFRRLTVLIDNPLSDVCRDDESFYELMESLYKRNPKIKIKMS